MRVLRKLRELSVGDVFYDSMPWHYDLLLVVLSLSQAEIVYLRIDVNASTYTIQSKWLRTFAPFNEFSSWKKL